MRIRLGLNHDSFPHPRFVFLSSHGTHTHRGRAQDRYDHCDQAILEYIFVPVPSTSRHSQRGEVLSEYVYVLLHSRPSIERRAMESTTRRLDNVYNAEKEQMEPT